jgi:hypothetical protein
MTRMSAGAEPQAGPSPAGRAAARLSESRPGVRLARAPSLAGWTITVMQLEGAVQKVKGVQIVYNPRYEIMACTSVDIHQLAGCVMHELHAVTCSYIHYMHYIFMSFC